MVEVAEAIAVEVIRPVKVPELVDRIELTTILTLDEVGEVEGE